MPTPHELALTAERFDEEQWLLFLDEVDAASRRRMERDVVLPGPDPNDRDAVAKWVARTHLAVDASIRQVLYLPKNAPANEIRLLEVNGRLRLPREEERFVRPIDFGLDLENGARRFKLLVADITLAQLDGLKSGHIDMPASWVLDEAIVMGRRE